MNRKNLKQNLIEIPENCDSDVNKQRYINICNALTMILTEILGETKIELKSSLTDTVQQKC